MEFLFYSGESFESVFMLAGSSNILHYTICMCGHEGASAQDLFQLMGFLIAKATSIHDPATCGS